MIRFGDNLAAVAVAKAAGVTLTPFMICISQHDDDGCLEGGILFEGYNGASVYTHVAGFTPEWCKPAWLYAAADFAFNHLKVNQAFGTVLTNNRTAVDFIRNLGYDFVVTLPGYFPEGDAYLMRLTKDQCRFLGEKYRKRYDRDRLKNAAARAA